MNDSVVKHRLLALLVADAAGYSRLMARDDRAALALLDRSREVFGAEVAAHGGRVIDMAGDSVLAVFDTAAGAVSAALAVQERLGRIGDESPADRRMLFRIGIHLGDVLEKADGSVYGDGVNIAARLQTLAEPGGITVSSSIREAVFNRVGAAFEDLGAQTVKNIVQPVVAFRLRWDKASAALGVPSAGAATQGAQARDAATTRAQATRSRVSRRAWIATLAALVLVVALAIVWLWQDGLAQVARYAPMSVEMMPFDAPAGDPAGAQYARQLRRDLLSGLVSFSRSVHPLQADDAASAGAGGDRPGGSAAPRARYRVEGDMRRERPGVMQAHLRLIDVVNHAQVWGEHYELPEAPGTTEAAIVRRRIVAAIETAILAAETRRVIELPVDRLDATELVLRGWASFERTRTLESTRQAKELFDAALRREPNLVFALSARSSILDAELDVDPHPDRDRMAHEMDEYSGRATQLDPDHANTWYVRSVALADGGRWNEALEAIDLAIRRDPHNPDLYDTRGWMMNMTGRPAEALPLVGKALSLNPGNTYFESRIACQAHLLLGQATEAVAACEKAAGLNTDWVVQLFLIAAYANHGDMAKAQAAKAQVLKVVPGYAISKLKAKRYSEVPEYSMIAEEYWYAGLRKAGIPD